MLTLGMSAGSLCVICRKLNWGLTTVSTDAWVSMASRNTVLALLIAACHSDRAYDTSVSEFVSSVISAGLSLPALGRSSLADKCYFRHRRGEHVQSKATSCWTLGPARAYRLAVRLLYSTQHRWFVRSKIPCSAISSQLVCAQLGDVISGTQKAEIILLKLCEKLSPSGLKGFRLTRSQPVVSWSRHLPNGALRGGRMSTSRSRTYASAETASADASPK